jgi:lysozyme
MSGPITVLGIDVSHYNGRIDWQRVAESGHSFAFVKASQGTDVTDPTFDANWQGVREAGMLRGAYHFLSPTTPGEAQARHFMSISGIDYELPPVVDVEFDNDEKVLIAQHPPRVAAWVQALHDWISCVEGATGLKPWIYTSRDNWSVLRDPSGFESCKLWVAHYGVSQPKIPNGWSTYSAWQFSSNNRIAGCEEYVDFNYLRVPINMTARSYLSDPVSRSYLSAAMD